jgi:2-polyprenyl-6-methoxyphenol hydroxylase-like FAD-dependent oxidoreductase
MNNALVAGGGITGLATAIVLARQGIEVDLVERQTQVRAIGSGITMIGAGVRALDRLGLYQECAASGYSVNDVEFYEVDGTLASRQRLPSAAGTDRPGMLGMMRPVLHGILLDHAAREGVGVRTGTSPARVEHRPGGASVTFSTGERRDYDLVVGADGLRSTVRDLIMDPMRPAYQGLKAFRVVLPRLPDVTAHRNFRTCANVNVGIMPIARDRMYMYGVFLDGEDYRPSPGELVSLIRAKIEPFGGIVPTIREAIREPDQVNITRFETVLAPDPWYRGRVIVIGDAAHCPSPQLAAGAAMGLEDAVALGEELADAPTIEQALRAFCDRRFDRCRYVVETTDRISYLQTHPGTSTEDLLEIVTQGYARLAGPF